MDEEGLKEKRGSFLDAPLLAGLNWEAVLYGLILIFAIFTRFWDLGSRAQHHDESMHAFYSWELSQGRGYQHNPLLHGPLLFHFTALIYFLFGTSDYTSRVGPAILGVALVFMPYFLRKWLGRYGALAAAAMLAISPGFLYYSRFIREDIFAAFPQFLLFVAIVKYLDEREDRYLYLTAGALALLFCTKEVSFITTFIFGVFLFGLFLWQFWKSEKRDPRHLASFDLVMVVGTLCLPLTSSLVIKILGEDPIDYTSPERIISLFVLLGLLALSMALGTAWDWRRWVAAAAIYYAIYLLLHTTFLTNMFGIATGLVGSLGYWLGQQGVRRGGQPWYYYLVLLPLYEFLPLFLALLGGVRYLLGFDQRREEEQRDPGSLGRTAFSTFLLWWAIAVFPIYSWAGEKMPWLIVHLALPLILWAGYTMGRIAEGSDWRALRERGGWKLALLSLLTLLAILVLASSRPVFGSMALTDLNLTLRWLGALVILVALVVMSVFTARRLGWGNSLRVALFTALILLALLTVRFAFIASYIHGDVAKDMLIYTQTTPDVTMVVREIEALSERLVGGKEMEVAFDDFTSWPFFWYLRDFPHRRFLGTGEDLTEPLTAPVVLVGLENEPHLRPYLADYIRQQYRLRWWFPEDYRGMSWQRIVTSLKDPQLRHSLWQFLFYRELENPLGSSDFAFYLRRDVAARLWRSSAVPIGPEAGLADEYAKKRIEVESVMTFGGAGLLNSPKDIALDAQGNLYVVDGGNRRVQVFDPEGRVMASWGGEGFAPGQFNDPWGILVDGQGQVYVADTFNHRVQKFDKEGHFLTYWGGTLVDTGGQAIGSPGLFFGPRDLVEEAEGNLYVTDTGNERVQKFDPQGAFLGQWGGEGSGPGQFSEPVGMAVDGEGNIYVADTWNHRIQKFDRSFRFLTQWPVEGWVSRSSINKPYLAVDSKGYVYATDPEGYRVLVFSSEGEIVAVFGKKGSDSASFDLPIGIAVDGEGYIYVADAGNNRVMKFPPLSPVGVIE